MTKISPSLVKLAEPVLGKPVRIIVWKNGEFDSQGQEVSISPKALRSWNSILVYLTKLLEHVGAVRKLYHLATKKLVWCFDDLIPGDKYVVSGFEKLKLGKDAYQMVSDRRYSMLQTLKFTSKSQSIKAMLDTITYTQKKKRTIIYIMVNGKSCVNPCKIVFIEEDLLDWDNVMQYMGHRLNVPEGIQYLCTVNGEIVFEPHQLQHGDLYIGVPFSQRFKKMDYVKLFHDLLKHQKDKISYYSRSKKSKSKKPLSTTYAPWSIKNKKGRRISATILSPLPMNTTERTSSSSVGENSTNRLSFPGRHSPTRGSTDRSSPDTKRSSGSRGGSHKEFSRGGSNKEFSRGGSNKEFAVFAIGNVSADKTCKSEKCHNQKCRGLCEKKHVQSGVDVDTNGSQTAKCKKHTNTIKHKLGSVINACLDAVENYGFIEPQKSDQYHKARESIQDHIKKVSAKQVDNDYGESSEEEGTHLTTFAQIAQRTCFKKCEPTDELEQDLKSQSKSRSNEQDLKLQSKSRSNEQVLKSQSKSRSNEQDLKSQSKSRSNEQDLKLQLKSRSNKQDIKSQSESRSNEQDLKLQLKSISNEHSFKSQSKSRSNEQDLKSQSKSKSNEQDLHPQSKSKSEKLMNESENPDTNHLKESTDSPPRKSLKDSNGRNSRGSIKSVGFEDRQSADSSDSEIAVNRSFSKKSLSEKDINGIRQVQSTGGSLVPSRDSFELYKETLWHSSASHTGLEKVPPIISNVNFVKGSGYQIVNQHHNIGADSRLLNKNTKEKVQKSPVYPNEEFRRFEKMTRNTPSCCETILDTSDADVDELWKKPSAPSTDKSIDERSCSSENASDTSRTSVTYAGNEILGPAKRSSSKTKSGSAPAINCCTSSNIETVLRRIGRRNYLDYVSSDEDPFVASERRARAKNALTNRNHAIFGQLGSVVIRNGQNIIEEHFEKPPAEGSASISSLRNKDKGLPNIKDGAILENLVKVSSVSQQTPIVNTVTYSTEVNESPLQNKSSIGVPSSSSQQIPIVENTTSQSTQMVGSDHTRSSSRVRVVSLDISNGKNQTLDPITSCSEQSNASKEENVQERVRTSYSDMDASGLEPAEEVSKCFRKTCYSFACSDICLHKSANCDPCVCVPSNEQDPDHNHD